MSQVGARIREVRNARGLTLSYVADMLHLSEATMSRYETGERKIVADLLAPLGEVLGVDPCLFVRDVALADSATLTDTLNVDRQPRREASYLDPDEITSKFMDITREDLELLLAFVSFWKARQAEEMEI